MKKFNYASYLYEQKVFDIETKKDREKFEIVINEIKEIEKHFSDLIPNLEVIKPIIAFSYRLNKELQVEDRINYIKGIIYSKRYIDVEDVSIFINYLEEDLDPEDSNSIFFNKGFSNNKYGFFTDAFDEDLLTYTEITDVFKNEKIIIDENGNMVDSETGNRVIIQPSSKESVEEIELEENDEDEFENNESQEEDEYYNYYYSVTPEEKLKLFKQNFEMFVVEIFKRKKLENETDKTKKFIILGMRDWYEYMMCMLDGAFEVNKAQKLYNSMDLTKFI